MKITKARLVEIIKEEIAGLDEATLGGLFGRGPKAPRSKRTFKGGAADDLDVRAGEVEAGDSTAGLNKAQMKAYSAAIADATADAAKMDAETSQKDFERVMSWANEEGVATEKDIAQAVVDAMKTMDSGMIAKIQEPLLDDPDFIEEIAKAINKYRHSGEAAGMKNEGMLGSKKPISNAMISQILDLASKDPALRQTLSMELAKMTKEATPAGPRPQTTPPLTGDDYKLAMATGVPLSGVGPEFEE